MAARRKVARKKKGVSKGKPSVTGKLGIGLASVSLPGGGFGPKFSSGKGKPMTAAGPVVKPKKKKKR